MGLATRAAGHADAHDAHDACHVRLRAAAGHADARDAHDACHVGLWGLPPVQLATQMLMMLMMLATWGCGAPAGHADAHDAHDACHVGLRGSSWPRRCS